MMVRGLTCNVHRNAAFGDCSNGGITSRYSQVTLIGAGIDGPVQIDLDNPPENTLVLVRRDLSSGPHLHAEPLDGVNTKTGTRWYSFGGNVIYTSDSRFPNGYPLTVHDRYEM